MTHNAEKHLLRDLMNAGDEWHDEDTPLKVVLLAKDTGVPEEVIQDAAEMSDVDFEVDE